MMFDLLGLIGHQWDIHLVSLKFFCLIYSLFLDDHDLVDDNEERVQIVQQIVDKLKLDKIVFMGHSRGTENALRMAALNQVCVYFDVFGSILMVLGQDCGAHTT